jgi:hypothetical protein
MEPTEHDVRTEAGNEIVDVEADEYEREITTQRLDEIRAGTSMGVMLAACLGCIFVRG